MIKSEAGQIRSREAGYGSARCHNTIIIPNQRCVRAFVYIHTEGVDAFTCFHTDGFETFQNKTQRIDCSWQSVAAGLKPSGEDLAYHHAGHS